MRISDWSSDVCSSDLFGGCAGQRRKTFGFQPTEEILQRQAESLRSMRDFQWRKSMDMNVRRARPHGAQYIEIGIAVIGRVNAALKAYLSRAAFHRFSRPATDFLQIKPLVRPANVPLSPSRKGAKAHPAKA